MPVIFRAFIIRCCDNVCIGIRLNMNSMFCREVKNPADKFNTDTGTVNGFFFVTIVNLCAIEGCQKSTGIKKGKFLLKLQNAVHRTSCTDHKMVTGICKGFQCFFCSRRNDFLTVQKGTIQIEKNIFLSMCKPSF